jgi:hypothetical protein
MNSIFTLTNSLNACVATEVALDISCFFVQSPSIPDARVSDEGMP